MQTNVTWTFMVVALLAACKSDTSKSSGTAPSASTSVTPAAMTSGSPEPSTTAAVPPPQCPAGFTGNPVPAYCIKLPDGYKVREAKITARRGAIYYDTGKPKEWLSVSYNDTPLETAATDIEREMVFSSNKLEKKGALTGGNLWFLGTEGGSPGPSGRLVTLVRAFPLVLKCSFTYEPKNPPSQEAQDACKSIVIP